MNPYIKRIFNRIRDINEYRKTIQYIDGGWYSSKVKIENPRCDAINCWSGNVELFRLYVIHGKPDPYSKACHPDVFQAFSMDKLTFKRNMFSVSNIVIRKAKVIVPDGFDYVRGFMFTGLTPYEDIHLFSNGLAYDHGDSSGEWFLQMTNAVRCTIGSPEHPIDPEKTSGLGIRIGNIKKDCKVRSRDVTIHCKKGLKLTLADDIHNLNIITY